MVNSVKMEGKRAERVVTMKLDKVTNEALGAAALLYVTVMKRGGPEGAPLLKEILHLSDEKLEKFLDSIMDLADLMRASLIEWSNGPDGDDEAKALLRAMELQDSLSKSLGLKN